MTGTRTKRRRQRRRDARRRRAVVDDSPKITKTEMTPRNDPPPAPFYAPALPDPEALREP